MEIEMYHSRPRDDIAERIECYMIEHHLQPGDRLPSERELCEAWNCNRMTFRAAIKRLIAEGKLYNVPSTGSFVAREKLKRNLQDLTSFSDFVMQKGLHIQDQILSSRILPASAVMAERLNVPASSEIFELARLRIVEDEPLSLETTLVPCLRFPGIQKYDFERLSLYAVMERKYGTLFTGGQEEISLTYADSNEAALLKIPEGEALFYLKGVTWDENDDPVEWIRSVSRTDRLSFAGQLTR